VRHSHERRRVERESIRRGVVPDDAHDVGHASQATDPSDVDDQLNGERDRFADTSVR
jgi:hypothetical protein